MTVTSIMNQMLAGLIFSTLLFTLAASIGPRDEYFDDGNSTCYHKTCGIPDCWCWNPASYAIKSVLDEFLDQMTRLIMDHFAEERRKQATPWWTLK